MVSEEKEEIKEEDFKVYESVLVDKPEKEQKDSLRMMLGRVYEEILDALKNYSDLKERDYEIIALWIIGTYFYRDFLTFPYLFLNATKGAGKSRTLRLICALAWNGQILGSITESVLFRVAGTGTLGLDEFEGIARKDNSGLREILNSGYKRGMKILRMKKKKTSNSEEYVTEDFEPYTPIVMANIWGMEEVLGDRCITSVLEKSDKSKYILKLEDYDNDLHIKNIKSQLNFLKKENLVYKCSLCSEKNIYTLWNNWVNEKYSTLYTNTTLTTYNTYNTPNFDENEENVVTKTEIDSFFNKIVDTGINGRDLELFMSLFLIGKFIGNDVLDKMLKIASETTKEKRKEELMESKDVLLVEYISNQEMHFIKIKELIEGFRRFIEYNSEDEYYNWCNSRWLGRALKRMGLIVDKRRMGEGYEVTLNIQKAKEKLTIFKNDTTKQ